MRILHLTHQYPPEYVGGVESYTWGLAQQQVKQGHSVAIFYPSVVSHTLQPELDGAIRVYRAPVGERSRTAVFRHTFHQPSLSAAFATVLQQEQPDIVHIQHLMGLPVSVVDQITAAQIPYVVALHDYWYLCANAQMLTNYDETNCLGPRWWLNCARCTLARAHHPNALPLIPALTPVLVYRHLLTRRVLQNAAAITASAEFVRQMYQQMGLPPEKIITLVYGIDVPEQMPPRVWPHQGLHLVYVGSIARQKGVHVLVEAFNQLPHEGARLSVFGDTAVFPAYTTHLKTIATHPGITFNGRIARHQLWHTLAEADALVMPTLWYETSPLVIREAYAAGVPVIGSEIGGLPETIHHQVNGILVPPGDVAALREVLYRCWQNPAELETLRAGITPAPTSAEHSQQIAAIYRRVIGQ